MLCGMTYLPPFALFGSRTAIRGRQASIGHIADWVRAARGRSVTTGIDIAGARERRPHAQQRAQASYSEED